MKDKRHLSLEDEAKKFTKRKRNFRTIKPLTTRRYLAGQALAGLLSGGRGVGRMHDVKKSAYDWADFMLDDDSED